MHPKDEIKRNNKIKKVVSNSRAIITNQIDFTVGCFKMKNLIRSVSDIKPIEEVNLKIFLDFYDRMAFYPIGEEKANYNEKYLANLDVEIQKIKKEFNNQIIAKCEEIIEKLSKKIKNVT